MRSNHQLDQVSELNKINILVSRVCRGANIVKQITFEQFLTIVLKVAKFKYNQACSGISKAALNRFITEHLLPLLSQIESHAKHGNEGPSGKRQSTATHLPNYVYSVSEQALNSIHLDEDSQSLLNASLPTLKDLYQAYFEHECAFGLSVMLGKDEMQKKSLKSLIMFLRDFEICPVQVHQKACLLIWYSVSSCESEEQLTNNRDLLSVVKRDQDKLGKQFTLGHFLAFVYRLSIVYCNHVQSQLPSNSAKVLYFMRRLETSPGFPKFLLKTGRPFNATCTLLPSNKALCQIFNMDYTQMSKESFINTLLDGYIDTNDQYSSKRKSTFCTNSNRSQYSSKKAFSIQKYNEIQDLLASIQDELRRLFEYYCQMGDPCNTQKLSSNNFIKIFKDCGLLVAKSTRNQGITTSDLDLIYKGSISQIEQVVSSKSQIDNYHSSTSVKAGM